MRISISVATAVIVFSSAAAVSQTRREAPTTLKVLETTTVWDNSIAGRWTYRSYRNRADVMVGADAEAPVQALVPVYGNGILTVNSAVRAAGLIFGEGVMTFKAPVGGALSGDFDMGGGYILDLKGTMQTNAAGDISIELFGTGRAGTPTENWEYDYRANTTPKWPTGVGQIPSLVGTVIRAKPHDSGAAGVTASFIAVKQ